MSDSNAGAIAPQMGNAVASADAAADIATKQATGNQPAPGELTQEQLEKMSGAEVREYFEAKKAREEAAKKGQPTRQADGKFAPKQPSNPVKEAAAEAVRKYKLKVDGQEVEVDEEELKRGYSHQKAASKILQEGKQARKQAEEFISMMKDQNKLFEAIQKLGHDPRKLAEQYLASQLEDEMMDPREKELRDAKAKLKSIEDMERQKREQVQKQYHEQMKQKYAQEYQQQFITALQETGLPPTKPMVAEMAKYIGRAAKIGFQMDAKEAAQLVREDIQLAHQRLVGDSDGETLIKLLGEEVANKVRKWDTSRIKTPESNLRTPVEQGAPRERDKAASGKRMSAKEWREYNRGKK